MANITTLFRESGDPIRSQAPTMARRPAGNTCVTAPLSAWLERIRLDRDLARALRSATAMGLGWSLCVFAGHVELAPFCATAAQNVAMPDVRGEYRSRPAPLLLLGAVASLAAFGGAASAGHVAAAAGVVAALALIAGAWRHASSDLGPQFAVVSTLGFFIGLAHPGDLMHAAEAALATGVGALVGLALQLPGWLVRPEQPLRRAVAEAWDAAADVLDAAAKHVEAARDADGAPPDVGELRTAVDRTLRVLHAASARRAVLVERLGATTLLASRLATRALSLLAALDDAPGARADTAPALAALLGALASASRAASRAVVARSPQRFVALEMELERTAGVLGVLEARLAASSADETNADQARILLAQLARVLPSLRLALGDTVERSAGGAVSLPAVAWEAGARPSQGWLDAPHPVDAALVRHTLRIGVLLVVAVAASEILDLAHGYWMPLCIVVVLQPDFGSTRKKAVDRAGGTLAGVVAGSALLFVPLPREALGVLAFGAAFAFAYYLRRRYYVAVFFVTLMIVWLTESATAVDLWFTASRLLWTLAGSAIALAAAAWFWPLRERDRFAKVLAAALRADGDYLRAVAAHLVTGAPFAGEVVRTKREAERASGAVTTSLGRMLGEPAQALAEVARATAQAGHVVRLTRAISVLAQHLDERPTFDASRVTARAEAMMAMLVAIADAPAGTTETATPEPGLGDARGEASLVERQLARIGVELQAIAAA